MAQQRRYQKFSQVGGYHYQNATGVGTNVKVGLAGKGTFLGTVIVNQPGTSITLTLMDGSTTFATITLAAGMVLPYNLALDGGLNYTLSGTADVTFCYLDYVE